MKVRPFLLLGLLWAASAAGQGTYLYTWHGSLGLFQASFQVTPDENQPGGYFESQTFYNSIILTSPVDSFTYSWPGGIAGGRMGPPLNLSISLADSVSQHSIAAFANQYSAAISELDDSDKTHPVELYAENGYWSSTYQPVPEPSCTSLLVLSGFAWFLCKRKGDSKAALSCKN